MGLSDIMGVIGHVIRGHTSRCAVNMLLCHNPSKNVFISSPYIIGSQSVRLSSYFTNSHEYAKVSNNKNEIVCGITDFAQASLGDIVYVELPEVGDNVQKGEVFGSVESVKSASEVYAPISGTIVEVNNELSHNPSLVNESAEHDGWFMKIKCSNSDEFSLLMNEDSYKKLCESKVSE